MVISPSVPSPRAGDPITAAWAANLADVINSCANPADRVGDAATPFGKATLPPGLPMLGDFVRPMPFDCVAWRAIGALVDHLYCYLPPYGETWRSYVFINQQPCDRSSSQQLGTAANPWVDLGEILESSVYTLVLAFEDIPGALPNEYQFKWRLSLTAGGSGDMYPTWASVRAPLVYIAWKGDRHSPATMTDGICQYHRGFVGVGGSAWNLGGYEETAWGKAIGNSSKAKVLDLDNRQLVGGWESTGDFTVANGTAKFFYGGNQYHPVNITDGNGNTYTVLAKV